MSGSEWYVGRDGKQFGPISEAEFKKLVEVGGLRPHDLVWTQGFAEWQPVSAVGLATVLAGKTAQGASPPPTLARPATEPTRPSPPRATDPGNKVPQPPGKAAPARHRPIASAGTNAGRQPERSLEPGKAAAGPQAHQGKGQENARADEVAGADVFVSYARADKKIAERFVGDLKAAGLQVWWDSELVGEEFRFSIERELAAAQCVVVIWSEAARASSFVRDEASRAHRARKLVQVRVDDFDPHNVPVGFGEDQISALSDMAQVLKAIASKRAAVSKMPLVAPTAAHSASIEDVVVEFARGLRFAAANGDLDAKLALAACFANGTGLEHDWKTSERLLAEVAASRHPMALLARAAEDWPDDVKNRKTLQELATQGSSDAKLMLEPELESGLDLIDDDDAPVEARKALIALLESYAFQRSRLAMGWLILARAGWHDKPPNTDALPPARQRLGGRSLGDGLGPRNLAEIAFFAIEFFKGPVYWQAVGLSVMQDMNEPNDIWVEVHKRLSNEGTYSGPIAREPSSASVRALLALRGR